MHVGKITQNISYQTFTSPTHTHPLLIQKITGLQANCYSCETQLCVGYVIYEIIHVHVNLYVNYFKYLSLQFIHAFMKV